MDSTPTKSMEIRKRLNHPIIDSDGHTVEFDPLLLDYVKNIGGSQLLERFEQATTFSRWYELSLEQRRARRITRNPWWALPQKNTLDHATSMFPKLLHQRMDDMGMDFSILYPTQGLQIPHINDDELRRAACRAINTFHADIFREYSDRMTPAGVIPMHTPEEAIDELEYSVNTLGLKAFVFAGYVRRPMPASTGQITKDSSRFDYAPYWLDNFCIDSQYDYDPVWAKCVSLKIAPTFHSSHQGVGARNSISNYMYNHLGHFASAGESLCKAMFMGGVTRRFPTLKFAFLESGVGWACSLYSDMIGHWKKRNGKAIDNYNPANLDRQQLLELARRYGGSAVEAKLASVGLNGWASRLSDPREDPAMRDEWALCDIKTPEDIRDLFVPNFYFGCEADDPINAFAFDTKKLPFGVRLNAIFSSDIGHWDVPDMREVGEEAHELVAHGIITEEDFRDFVFTNPAKLWLGMNSEFFTGTVIESYVKPLVTRA